MWDQVRERVDKRVESLQKGYRQNVGIIGAEGIGKTHFLNSLHRSLLSQPQLLSVYVHASAFDFDYLMEEWIRGLLSSVFLSRSVRPPDSFQSLLAAADPILPKTMERIRQLKKIARREKNTEVVRELFAIGESLVEETGKKMVFMIDEFQDLADLPASDPFALLGREVMIEKNTLYIVASSKPQQAKEIFREKLSMLFGNFEIMELAPLGCGRALRFWKSQFPDKKFGETQKRFLIRLTNGTPAYLELLADQLSSQLRNEISFWDDVEDRVFLQSFNNELFDPRGRISLMFQRRIDACKRISKEGGYFVKALWAIASGRKKISTISVFIQKSAKDTRKILERLVEDGRLSKKGSFYILEDPLFGFWLRQVMSEQSWFHWDRQAWKEKVEIFLEPLRHELDRSRLEVGSDIAGRLESLFKEFRNDTVEINHRKISCPQFSEIAFRPTNGRVFPVFAKGAKSRWACQIAYDLIKEEDVNFFIAESKSSGRRLQKRLLIALGGIEQNAKLIAQEAKIQIWGLENFNELLELYDLPKIIFLPEEEWDGANLGALA